jgi:hypothetical protein
MSFTPNRSLAILAGLVLGVLSASAQPPTDPPPVTKFDKDGGYMYRLKDFTPLKIEESRLDHDAFCDLALHTHKFSTPHLLAAARKDLSYANLMAADDRVREEARFELVRVDGRLKRLKRIGSYDLLKAAGIPDIYEAWVFPKERSDPVCLMLTEAPEGIEPAEDIDPGRPVSTCGYFFKVVEYLSAEPHPKKKDQNLYRRAPLLVGKSLVARPDIPTDTDGGVVVRLLPAVAVGAVVLILVLLALAFWLKRTDVGTRNYLAQRDRNPFTDSPQLASEDTNHEPTRNDRHPGSSTSDSTGARRGVDRG